MKSVLIFLFTLFIHVTCLGGYFNPATVADTEQGPVEGMINSNGTQVYLGIPFAAPPVGNLRWRAPEPAAPRVGIYQAFKPGPISLQKSLFTDRILGSEDCLYLNIWVPASAKSKSLPVMFWVHGGAFILGDSIQKLGMVSLYDGAKLAEKGEVILVTANYRLGPMGFMAHKQLAKESKSGTTGNYGILDQIAALKWVQKNIENFGGDPARVTLFGESAGGASVLTLVASPLTRGLFSQAITQSGPLMEMPLEVAAETGDRIMKKYTGKSMSLENLRQVSGERIVRDFPMDLALHGNGPMTQYAPVIDGHVLKSSILETFEKGQGAKIPMIIGSNKDEMTVLAPVFLRGLPNPLTDSQYLRLVRQFHGDKAEELVGFYSSQKYGTNKKALIAMMADTQFHAPVQQIAAAMERYNPHSTFTYVFSQESNFLKAGHGLEISYLFQNPLLLYSYNHNPLRPIKSLGNFLDQMTLSNTMIGYWTSFAHYGNPNGKFNFPYWPDSGEGGILQFDSKDTKVLPAYQQEQVTFWDKLSCGGTLTRLLRDSTSLRRK